MKVKLSVIGLIASVALFVAFAGAQQQSDSGMQQSGQSADQQQKGAMTQDPQTIKQVQQALSDQGYYKGPADGKWGSKTESALKEFQQAKGMQATGQLDQQTLASLGIRGGAGAGGQQDMSSQPSGAGGQQGGMQDQQGGQMGGAQQGGSKY